MREYNYSFFHLTRCIKVIKYDIAFATPLSRTSNPSGGIKSSVILTRIVFEIEGLVIDDIVILVVPM